MMIVKFHPRGRGGGGGPVDYLLGKDRQRDGASVLQGKPDEVRELPALLRQLAGMGNNLNQIARQVNAGGGSGHDRVQIVAALMAIDAGLERLRHAVLEKGADDDR
ncbi:MobC family plasmid mobilization relaxosome protein [Salmonella enterica]|uniref:MobC family plasmid mobilization relaxosome protein n=1 Tax=Salmonella enterica TaxID=28901 RepID=UPI0021B0B3EF|nr:MobC family plasmid mobilization relaxosome protein [Salmonella enterica]